MTATIEQATGGARSEWEANLPHEIAFWDGWVSSKGGRWADGFVRLLDPNRELPPQFAALLPERGPGSVRLLDVGAGPLTSLAVKIPGRTVETVAIDPLARQYDKILQSNGVVPLVRTQPGEAEHLAEQFGVNQFDLTHASNCLDHCYDPFNAIREMLSVTKPGGFVVLEHATNEAVAEKYTGLHQWNLDAEDGEFILWKPGVRLVLTQLLALEAEITVTVAPFPPDRQWISARLKKLTAEQRLTKAATRCERASAKAPNLEQPLRYQLVDDLNRRMKALAPAVHRGVRLLLSYRRTAP